ncbi:hypothetical protein EX227_15685 [Providencia rettgeri]|uniref:Uncharacterized protein n=1 Tax=Providencia rettgeri TaxID=587 RepID=A0A9Q3MJ03_PRORE|nr:MULTISPECIES: hypothetical protein [Gammaproteobacteria]HEM8344298.1 hypothetical protein [Providencia stuartii]EKH6496568.1 hypothetical protein [Providencia rettgeri]ELR5052056.1 hypothetical protein [Providencia rettgeri]ELR5157149.1 hypothetical protein [Providencia rettgeri]ELR5182303.1 hypothetical protein [Providencia rettgeri]
MLSKAIEPRKVSKAELKFREAFERLKVGKPDILPKGTPLSQNNVAKEAGVDPSALRRARFPELVADIQAWIESHKDEAAQKSPRQMMLAQRSRNRDLLEKVKVLEEQRDKALGQLLDAQFRILELTLENQRLQAQLPASNVHFISNSKKPS